MNTVTKTIGYGITGLACTFGHINTAKAHCHGWEFLVGGLVGGALTSLFCPRVVVATPAYTTGYTVGYTTYQPTIPTTSSRSLVLPATQQKPALPEMQPGDTATLQKDGSWVIVRQPAVSATALTNAVQQVNTKQ